MAGSIGPRCETVRGTHWPKPGRVVVWSSRRGNHLGQRSKPTASTGRTYGCKRSDQTRKNSCGTGAVHIWVLACRLRRSFGEPDSATPAKPWRRRVAGTTAEVLADASPTTSPKENG